jgi:hypothetical protein
MTFEQGGIRAGLAIIDQDGDTLTLYDRLMHHYTTGMSTIEICSQNSSKLVKEFHKYFVNAQTTPYGEFKAYLIKGTKEDIPPLYKSDKLKKLEQLLDRNLIEWGYASPGNFTGFNYLTGKTEIFKADQGDIVINMNQSKSNLIKVLFERSSKISDSATYDITAWSVPFAYGLKAYGLTSYVALEKPELYFPSGRFVDHIYGYAIRWNGLNSAQFLAELLKKGVKVRYAEQPFKSVNQEFEKGTLIVARTSNGAFDKNLNNMIDEAAAKTNASLFFVTTGLVDKGFDFGSDRVHVIHKPRVALLTGNGVGSSAAGEVWHFFEQQLNYPVSLINADDVSRVAWKNYDVLIMPDGRYKLFSDKNSLEALKNWVQEGGKIIALENAVQQLSKTDWGLKQKNTDDKKDDDKDRKEDYSALHRYENRERDELVNSTPGAIYKVELDNSHPLAFGYPDYYYTLKQDENVYEFLKDGGWNVGIIRKDNYVSGFTGSKAKEKLKDGLVFGVQEMGKGQIVYLADDVLFRSFWENGKLLFCNAVFLVGQ